MPRVTDSSRNGSFYVVETDTVHNEEKEAIEAAVNHLLASPDAGTVIVQPPAITVSMTAADVVPDPDPIPDPVPDPVPGSGVLNLDFQLDPNEFVQAKMVPVITHPRPDGETNTWAKHRTAPSALPFRIPIAVQGGARPLQYTLVSGPSGMAVSQDAILSWASPTIGTHSIEIRIRTQDYGRQPGGRNDADWGEKTITWDLVVSDREDNTKFIFLSGSGNDSTGDGSYSTPFRGLAKVFESAAYAGMQLHLLTGTYDTDGTGTFFRPGDSTPIVISGVFGQSPVVNFTQKAFTPAANADLFLGDFEITDGGYGATVANVRLFQPYSGVERDTFFNVTITSPSNGTAGNDNSSFVMTGGGSNPGKQYMTFMHCTETGRAGSSNSAGLYALFSADYVVSEYNSVTGSGQYNMFLKDSNKNCTSAFNTVLGGFSAMSTGCQLQAYTTENIEVCYNKTDCEVRFNHQFVATTGVHYCYRNSIEDDIFIQRPDEAGTGPYNIEKNAMEGTINSGSRVSSTDTECVAASGVLDASQDLMGTYRTNYLGTRGEELAT